MAIYKVVSGANTGCKIEVNDNGVKHTILGFDTEAEAVAWIEADQVRENA